jgi:hypothetical protein
LNEKKNRYLRHGVGGLDQRLRHIGDNASLKQ